MTLFRRVILVVVLSSALGGCASNAPPPLPATTPDAEEREEFLDDLQADIAKIESFQQKTQRGANLSEFTLGWFAMIMLSELSSQDEQLHARFHSEGGSVESYLRGIFQNDPQAEIAAITSMTGGTNPSLRRAARYVLEMLLTIPDSGDPPEVQALARHDLIVVLGRLRDALSEAAAAAAVPSHNP